MRILLCGSLFVCLVALVVAIPAKFDQYVLYESADEVYNKKVEEYLKTVPKAIAEEARMTVPQLIQHKGYPVEVHTVTTSDGYILDIHRIPYGRGGPSENRPVAFLQHGLLCSSADWVITGPENALGYFLADEGFDVWMGNFRGTRYGRNHTDLDPSKDKKKFWDFSWHEMGTIDLPTMIDYVLAKTGAKDLFHVGHSQGTTTFYIMTSERPEYNEKIRAHFSLAPIAYMKNLFSPLLRIISKFDGTIEALGNLIGMHEFLPNTGFLGEIGEMLCGDNSATQILCTNSLFAIAGFSHKQMNATILPILMGHTPAGAATKQLLHYAQLINSGLISKFRQYDYGFLENMKKYGKASPPSYDLENIKAPIYLFYSENDWLAAITDVDKLNDKIKGVIKGKFLVADRKFNHLDYMFGVEARELVYEMVVTIMHRLKNE